MARGSDPERQGRPMRIDLGRCLVADADGELDVVPYSLLYLSLGFWARASRRRVIYDRRFPYKSSAEA